MKRFVLVAVVAGLAGCVHGQTVIAPDGHPATVVTCHYQDKCYLKAERLCPWGFQVMEERQGTLLFRCPYPAPVPGQYPPAPGQSPPAPGQSPPAPTAPGSTPAQPQEKLYHT